MLLLVLTAPERECCHHTVNSFVAVKALLLNLTSTSYMIFQDAMSANLLICKPACHVAAVK